MIWFDHNKSIINELDDNNAMDSLVVNIQKSNDDKDVLHN